MKCEFFCATHENCSTAPSGGQYFAKNIKCTIRTHKSFKHNNCPHNVCEFLDQIARTVSKYIGTGDTIAWVLNSKNITVKAVACSFKNMETKYVWTRNSISGWKLNQSVYYEILKQFENILYVEKTEQINNYWTMTTTKTVRIRCTACVL